MKRLFLLLILLAPMVFSYPTVVTVLDNFNRADANPISGSWGYPLFIGNGNPRIVSNLWWPGTSGGGVHSSGWYNAATYGPDLEVYGTVTKPDNGSALYIIARIRDAGLSTVDCYVIYITSDAGTDTWTLYRVDNGSFVAMGATVNLEFASGDSIGMSLVGSTIEAWRKPAAGSWTLIISRTDATYNFAGNVGLAMSSSASILGRWDDLTGGTLGSAAAVPISSIFHRRRQ